MLAIATVWVGLIAAALGLILSIKPLPRGFPATRPQALALVAAGSLVVVVGMAIPPGESRVAVAVTALDRFAPVWQFGERHALSIAAPPERVFEAVEEVRADEIRLFRLLTWLRRGGRPLPDGILDAGVERPLLDVATGSDFERLAYDPPGELVIGTAVIAPDGAGPRLSAEEFRGPLPPGYALAAMNFLVRPDGAGGSLVTTETRVYANSPAVRRRFAAYWRVIYPGSALIRRMWLQAIDRRATGTG